MEFDNIIVKENPGLCRCCLSEGCYKELGTEYPWMDETEVYADMLLECFDISISQHIEGPNGTNRLICEVCITRLRDACNFKKQVMDCEKKFVDMIGRGEFKQKALPIEGPNMKSEINLEEHTDVVTEIEYLEDGIDYDDDKDDPTQDITVETLPVKPKRGRPKKNAAKVEKKAKEEKPRTSKSTPKGVSRGCDASNAIADSFEGILGSLTTKTELSTKEKRKIMRNNVLQVLIKSTVMPFRWLKSSYRCFYCYDIFQESSELKNHQITHVGDEIKEITMSKYWEPIVYVDISNLACKLCTENVTDLYELIDHLVDKHGTVYNKDVGTCMIPFKLDNFSLNCLTCGAGFYTFGPLLHHTNKDHKGTSAILCEVCGQHFKDGNLLRLHMKSVHENSGLLCQECGDKFETRYKLKSHQKYEHDMDKKYKCLVCTQIFRSHYKRSRHMATEHKNREEIKCLHCPKTFVFRSMMMTHLRDTHLKVRNHICSVCGWKAFNSNRLKNHMYKHSGEKNFKCDVCEKLFTTRKIMRAHFARMHKAVQPPTMGYEHQYRLS